MFKPYPNTKISQFGQDLKTVLGSTHVVEQLSFSMHSSIMTFDFDLILGSFLSLMGS